MRGQRCRSSFSGVSLSMALVWVLAALAAPEELFGQTRIGSEFHVNSYTPDSQAESAVATDAAGNFVVVWNSSGQDGNGNGVFAQRFSSTGAALGAEFQVNEFTNDSQWRSSVALDADGDFVIAWESFGDQDGDRSGVFAKRFSSAGAALGGEFQVNTFTTNDQTTPAVAAQPDGDFVVVWWSAGQNFDLFFQRFSSAGAALGGEFQVNTYTPDDQRYPSVAITPDGGFVVAWESYQDGGYAGVFAQRFSSAGAALGGEIQVNTYTVNEQGNPVVAVHADGGFVVVWSSYLQDGYGNGIFARRFSSAGDAVNDEFQVNTYTAGGEYLPVLGATPDGGFIVVWAAYDEPTGNGIFARRYSSEGVPVGGELQVNSYTDYPGEPSIAIDSAGNFVVAWDSYGREDYSGIFAQRFALAAAGVELDVDGDGQTEALTDGLLVLRYLFGFTGTTLTSGAVDTQHCSRCDAAAIEPYLTGLGLALDIDGNGMLGALTDGLLALRYLFGFTGATLTSGAVDLQNCTRCDATAIEPYLLGLTN